jgi:hypothetical protein
VKFAQPVMVIFALEENQLHQVRQRLRFGGREPMINKAPEPKIYSITVSSTEDLQLIRQALEKNGGNAWINVPTAQGIASIPLSKFLQQTGLV